MILTTSRIGNPYARPGAALDVTRKSGCEGLIWAPSAKLVFPTLERLKAAQSEAERDAIWAEYAAAFRAEMGASWLARRPQWEALLRREALCLQCYCVDSRRCHRTLLALDILPGACKRLGIALDWKGELVPHHRRALEDKEQPRANRGPWVWKAG